MELGAPYNSVSVNRPHSIRKNFRNRMSTQTTLFMNRTIEVENKPNLTSVFLLTGNRWAVYKPRISLFAI